MTPVVRVFALGLTASLGVVGLMASGARAASNVDVDMSVLDDLGPSRGAGAPIVLTPPAPEAAPSEAKAASAAVAKPEPAPHSEELTPAPTDRPAAVASTTATVESKRAAEPAGKPAATGGSANRIVFAKGSADLPRSADRVLEPLVKALVADPRAELAISAYAEGGEAGKESARRLALSRALAVRRYLESHGIEGARARIDARSADAEGGPADRVDVAIAKN